MSLLAELQARFLPALARRAADPAPLAAMIRPAQDAKFGDYQANFAMSLGKQLGRPPRDVAQEIVAEVELADLCGEVSIAGPGFINLRLRDDLLTARAVAAVADDRLGVAPAAEPRTVVVDYSSPNVAKPMHVGHIRSTVIGDALYRVLTFLGHRAISDNHLGDWGSQFGMIIYGYKHFRDEAALAAAPVAELGRLYKLVRQLSDYHEARGQLAAAEQRVDDLDRELAEQQAAPPPADKETRKKFEKQRTRLKNQAAEAEQRLAELRGRIAAVESDPALSSLAAAHAAVAAAVLEETARLHAGDAENLALWRRFMPACLEAIHDIYRRLGISFDYEHGESFYHDRLAAVVESLVERGLARESDGAMCVFLDGFETPMIVRKRDGAFLYATTDLATIQYRLEHWSPHAILYVVDHRQSEHFGKLFAAARLAGLADVELAHVSFGTVLGDDGRPFRTRAGDTVGLESLLDDAVAAALRVVSDNDDAKPDGPELSADDRRRIAEVVGLGAIKYADLSQNRTTDYVFNLDKMVALKGNTSTYLQYAYARIQNIFARGGVDLAALRAAPDALHLEHPAERALALAALRLSEALDEVLVDYRPNQLTGYLFDTLAKAFSEFYEVCPVLKAERPEQRTSRLLLCDLTARTLRVGLDLLGIGVVDKM